MEELPIEVTYKFHLPDNAEELRTFQGGNKYRAALDEIFQACRYKWKYTDAHEETKEFAMKIQEMADLDEID